MFGICTFVMFGKSYRVWKIGWSSVRSSIGRSGKEAAQAFRERLPVAGAVEAVTEQKAAAVQVFAQVRDLRIREVPRLREADEQEGPVVDVIAIVEIHGLLDRRARWCA